MSYFSLIELNNIVDLPARIVCINAIRTSTPNEDISSETEEFPLVFSSSSSLSSSILTSWQNTRLSPCNNTGEIIISKEKSNDWTVHYCSVSRTKRKSWPLQLGNLKVLSHLYCSVRRFTSASVEVWKVSQAIAPKNYTICSLFAFGNIWLISDIFYEATSGKVCVHALVSRNVHITNTELCINPIS